MKDAYLGRWYTAIVAMAVWLGCSIECVAPAAGAPANTLPEMWRALQACVRVPSKSVGSELTIVFALNRNGTLQGQPRITYSHLVGDLDTQKAFIAAAIASVAECLPIQITDGLGGAIAGRLFSIRIGSHPKESDT
jgi:hypothetical protein